jgi:hypothetical protein
MIPKLGKMQRVDVRSAWANEASHFTPWLASDEGMELLQDALGMDLEVEATEKFVGPFKADILAKRTDTTDDHWVLIENQLERTDHRHLGQLLTYAAGLDAVTIVWIAESFAEEHRAALDWLNSVTGDGLEFFGLEIELWQIAGSPPAPMFNVVAEPNDWSRNVQQGAKSQVSDLKSQQQKFWEGLRSRLIEKKSVVRPQKAHPQHWASFALGRAGTGLNACINSQKSTVWIEFAFYGPPGKVWYDEVLAKKDAIEAAFGEALDWQRMEGKKQSRVALHRPNSDFDNEQDWPNQYQWLIEKLELFHKVFQPVAKSLSAGVGFEAPLATDEPDVD